MDVMQISADSRHIDLLPDALWNQRPAIGRSPEITPLYVMRRVSNRWRFNRLGKHDYPEIIAVHGGRGEVFGVRAKVRLAKDSVMLIPPGVPHAEVSEERMDCTWMGLRGECLSALRTKGFRTIEDSGVAALMENMWFLAQQRGVGGELDGMARTVVARFLRILSSNAGASGDDLIARAIHFMHAHLSEKVTVERVARHVHCCEGYLHRAFKKRTGRSPMAWLTSARMSQARHWLQYTDRPVHEIGAIVGYTDPYYFSRAFRKETKLSPTAYRMRHR